MEERRIIPAYSREGDEDGKEVGKYVLFIGVPTYNKPDTLFSIDSMWPTCYHIGRSHPEIKHIYILREVRTYRQMARQAIVDTAKQVKATHLWMLDDDMVFTPQDFDKVWGQIMATPGPSAASGLYMVRSKPATAPCMFRVTRSGTVPIFDYPSDTWISHKDGVEVIGFGFVMFQMGVFDCINPPYFNLGDSFGEDAAFCARLLHAGIPFGVHTGARIGHIHEDPHVITEKDYFDVKEGLIKNAQARIGQLVPISDPEAASARRMYAQQSLDPERGWRGSSSKLVQWCRRSFGQGSRHYVAPAPEQAAAHAVAGDAQ